MHVFEKENKSKQYSLYDKWKDQDITFKNPSLEQNQYKENSSNETGVVEREDKLPWEFKNSSSLVHLTKDIKQGSSEVENDKSSVNVNTNTSG